MLVLKRKKGESIVINGNITIVVVEVNSTSVTLGVNAPKEVVVNRQEVQRMVDRGRGQSGS